MIKLFTYLLIIITTSCSFDDLINGANIYEATPLYPSISLFHHEDYKECTAQANKFLKYDIKGVNIVINQYVNLKSKTVQNYCYKYKDNSCSDINDEIIKNFEKELTKCIDQLVKNDIEITILPHIDDKNGEKWRNEISYNPTTKLKGYNYSDILINPILNALTNANANKVYFNMVGEMGNTLFMNAKEYKRIANQIKEVAPSFKVGAGLNFNKINGGAKPSKIKLSDLQKLIQELDFLGFSNYKAVNPRKNEIQFQDAVWDFIKELKTFGIIFPKTKELHFSEIGIGGGARKYDGHTAATSYKEALGSPYSGIHSAYSKATDPWSNLEVKKARYFYYYTLAKYLSKKKRYNLTRAYLWNVGSWDFMSIYPGTWGYEDSEITKYLIKYNNSLYLE